MPNETRFSVDIMLVKDLVKTNIATWPVNRSSNYYLLVTTRYN